MFPTLFRPVGACCLLALTSCSSIDRQAPEQDTPTKDLHYQIEYSGQTISHVADWFTGKHSNWSKILAHNPGLEPRKLRIGDTVIIPGQMLVRREKFPKARVRPVGRSVGHSAGRSTASYRTIGNRPSLPEPPASVLRAASARTQAPVAEPKALPPIEEKDLMATSATTSEQAPKQAPEQVPEQTAATEPAPASDPVAQPNEKAEQRAMLAQNPEEPSPAAVTTQAAGADSATVMPATVIPAQDIPAQDIPLQTPTTQPEQTPHAKQIIRDCDGISCVVQHSAAAEPNAAPPTAPSPPKQ